MTHINENEDKIKEMEAKVASLKREIDDARGDNAPGGKSGDLEATGVVVSSNALRTDSHSGEPPFTVAPD